MPTFTKKTFDYISACNNGGINDQSKCCSIYNTRFIKQISA